MIAIEQYDKNKMDAIEKRLISEYAAREDAYDMDEFMRENAPQEYLDYIEACRDARERLKKEGKMA